MLNVGAKRALLTAGLLAFVLAGCGGAPASAPSTPAGEATDAPPVTGIPDVTAAPVETPGSAATAQPDQPPAGGGVDVQDPCALATVEEVATALGEDVVEAEAITGDETTYCNYKTADGTLLLATSFSRGQAFVFDAFKGSDDAIPVPAIGDDAVFSSGTLFIKRGDAVVGIQPVATEIDDPQQLIELVSELARAVAGRL